MIAPPEHLLDCHSIDRALMIQIIQRRKIIGGCKRLEVTETDIKALESSHPTPTKS
jgi:hypothetical protein